MAKAASTKTPLTAEERALAIANAPRQSVVSFADYIVTLAAHAPDQLDELVDPSTAAAALAAVNAAGDLFSSTTEAAIAKTIEKKIEAAINALSNTAPLTGYAGYVFDDELFTKKVTPSTGRVRLSPEAKAARIVEDATPEQLDALEALIAARKTAE